VRALAALVCLLGCSPPAQICGIATRDVTVGSRAQRSVDLDADGFADLVVLDREQIYVYRGGRGGLAGTPAAEIENPAPDLIHGFDGDLRATQDGFAVKAIFHGTGAAAWVRFGGWPPRASGIELSLEAPLAARLRAKGVHVYDVDDIDGDGRLDALGTHPNSDSGFVPYLARYGTPRSEPRFETACVPPLIRDGARITLRPRNDGALLADVTGDRRADLVIAVSTDLVQVPGAITYSELPVRYQVWVFRGHADGFERDPIARVATSMDSPLVASPGDVDGDGFDDVVAADGATLFSAGPVLLRLYHGGPDGLRRERSEPITLPVGEPVSLARMAHSAEDTPHSLDTR
jgi:hypothetical protein